MSDFTPEERAKLPALLERWNIAPGQRVLEPGCGSGRLTAFLSEAAGPDGRILAMDMSPEMAHRAAKRIKNPNTSVVRGSVYGIPAEDAFFDQAICFCVFPHLTRRLSALRELMRVLKPSGSLWISHFIGSEALNAFHRDTNGVVSDHFLPAEEEMRELIREANFEIVQYEDSEETGFCLRAVRQP